MNTLLSRIVRDCAPHTAQGHVATYIPELAKVDPDKLGIYVSAPDGDHFAGDCAAPFTMQSVVKPLILLLALMDSGIDTVRQNRGIQARIPENQG